MSGTLNRTIKFEFTFHSVGQGLFYSGRIGKANFIYDCGGDKANVEASVREYVQRNKKIDCAFISHLHRDHVNGVKELLAQGVRINRVVLPYFDPFERAYLMFSTGQEYAEGDWYWDFMRDPILYFAQNKNVIEVIVVGRGDGNEDEKYEGSEPNDNIGDEDPFFHFKKLAEIGNKDLEKQVAEDEPEFPKYGGRVKYIGHHNNVIIYNFWVFRLFNFRIDDTTLLDCFIKCITEQLGDEQPLEHISNQKKRKELKKCYKLLIQPLKSKAPDPLNNTSLFLFHGPLLNRNSTVDYGCSSMECSHINLYRFVECYEPLRVHSARFGHLLTGDANLIFQYEAFRRHYSSYREQITHALIPHHGSFHNWNNEVLGYAQNCLYWIASSKIASRHGHPNASVLLDILSAHRYFCWSNELQKVEITGRVWWQ